MGVKKANRFLAALLAAVIVFTSVDVTAFAANYVDTTEDGEFKASAEEMFVNEYGLGSEALTVLSHDGIKGLDAKYDIKVNTPGNSEEELAKIDSDNLKVYAKKYTTDGYTWVPASFVVKTNAESESIAFTAGTVTYEEKSYDAVGDFNGKIGEDVDDYSIIITYTLSAAIPAAEQNAAVVTLNTLANGMSDLEAANDVVYDLVWDLQDTYIKEVYNFTETLNGLATYVEEAGNVKPALEEADAAITALDQLLTTDFDEVGNSTNFLLSKGASVKEAVENVYTELGELKTAMKAAANALNENPVAKEQASDAIKALNKFSDDVLADWTSETGALKAAADRSYDISSAVSDSNADFSDEEFEDAVKALKTANVTFAEFFVVAEDTITCQVNRYDVKVDVKVQTAPETPLDVDAAEAAELVDATYNVTVTLKGGTAADDVEDAVEDAIAALLKEKLGETEAEQYALAGDGIAVEGELATDLTFEDPVIYAPKLYTVSVTTGDAEPVEVDHYYGTKLKLTSPANGNSYDYKVAIGTADADYKSEGDEITVTDKVSVTRSECAKKETYRVYTMIADDANTTLSDAAKAVLRSAALESETVSFHGLTEDALGETVRDGDNYQLKAETVSSGWKDTQWVPYSAVLKNGSTVLDCDVHVAADGTITWTTDKKFTGVVVSYKLNAASVTTSELAALNELAAVVSAQNDALTKNDDSDDMISAVEVLATLDENSTFLNSSTLNTLQILLDEVENADAIEAVNVIRASVADGGCWYTDDSTSRPAIYNDLLTCQSNGWSLKDYYLNNRGASMSVQAKRLAENLDIIVNTKNFGSILENAESVLNKELSTYEETIRDMVTKLEALAPNLKGEEALKATGVVYQTDDENEFATLLNNLKDVEAGEFTTSGVNGACAYETAVATAPGFVSVSVTVKKGEIAYSVEPIVLPEGKLGENLADIQELVADAKELANIEAEEDFYLAPADLDYTESTVLTGNVKIELNYEPKTYRVALEDGTQIGNTYTFKGLDGIFSVLLPEKSSDASEDVYYVYTVGDEEITVPNGSVGGGSTKEFTAADLKALFTGEDNTLVISRKEVSTAQENIYDFVDLLNSGLKGTGAAVVPVVGKDGNVESLILRTTATTDMNQMMDLATGFITAATMSSYEYIGFAEGLAQKTDFKYNDASGSTKLAPQAFVDMMLNGGLTSKKLLETVDENGNVKEIKLPEGSTAQKDGILNANESLGGTFVESKIYLGNEAKTSKSLNLYITMVDEGTTLKSARKMVNAAYQYMTFNMSGGTLDLSGELPATAYKLYLSAMLVTGQLDIENVEPSLEADVEYMKGILEDLLIKPETEMNAQTLENTLKGAGFDIELDEYAQMVNMALNNMRELLKEDGNPSLKKNEEESDNNSFVCTISYDLDAKLNSMEGISELKGMLASTTIEVPVELNIWNYNEEYEAIIVDLKASRFDKLVYTEDLAADLDDLTGANMVILLKDITGNLTFEKKTVLNLNGKTIDGNVTAKDGLRIVSSVLDAQTAGGITGTITAANGASVRIGAGKYAPLSADMLCNGFVQDENGVVTCVYYQVAENEEGITVTLDTTAIEDIAEGNLQTIGLELVSDLLFNLYSNAAVSVGGYEIYNFEVGDVLGKFDDLGALATEMVKTVNKTDITKLVKELNDKLSVEGLLQMLETDGGAEVVSYDYTTAPWALKAEITDDNRIGVGVKAGAPETKKLTIRVAEDKDLAGALRGIKEIVEIKNTSFAINDISYVDEKLTFDIDATTTVIVDLQNKEEKASAYVNVLAVILANNIADADEKAAFVKDIAAYQNNYYAEPLKARIEAMTVGQLVDAIYAAEDVEFAAMAESLGMGELLTDAVAMENVYDCLLQVGYDLVKLADRIAGDRELVQKFYAKTLNDWTEETYGTYTTSLANGDESIKLTATLKLFASNYNSSVQKVIDLINAIPNEKPGTTQELEDVILLIEAAREAYDALSDEEKELVYNYEHLIEAEGWYEELGLWMTTIPAQDYAGKAIKPEIRVYEGAKRLQVKKDYTITYRNNKNAYNIEGKTAKQLKKSAPAVVVKMKGNYKGSVYNYFTINQLDISTATPYVNGEEHVGLQVKDVYTTTSSKRKTGKPVVYLNGKKLSTSEYTLLYLPKLAAGEAGQQPYTSGAQNDWTIRIIGKGKNIAAPVLPEGQTTKTWKWTFANVAEQTGAYYDATQHMATVAISSSNVKVTAVKNQSIADWENGVVTPELTIKYKGQVLKMATEQDENGNYNGDYRIVSWKNNTKIGTASVTIAGTNNYDYDGSVFEGAAKTYSFTGYRTIKFKIVGTNLASTTKCLVDTGKKIADRVYTGDAIVLTEKDAEGNGDYALYNRMGTKKDTSDDVKLVEGVDYTVSYSKNTNKGTATVKFTGIGNYYGTVKKTFKIKAAALTAEMQTSAAAFTVAYQKSGVKPKEMITLKYNGKTLVYGKDYTITWKNNTKVGAAPEDGSYNSKAPRYQIKGKGNFAGTLAWTNFTIEAAAQAEQVAMTAKNVLSKGTAKNGWTTSYKTTVTLVDTTNGKKLKAGTDYEKTYTYTYVENGVATDKAVVETVNSKGKNTGKISMLDETTGTTKPYMELAVTVTGKNNYAGLQKTETYRIYTQSISKMKVAGVVNQTYDRGEWDLTNKEQFPNFRVYKVTGSGKNKVQTDLNYMSDYTITYSKSPIFAGKITATIEGQGAYGGTMKVSFSIKSADANVSVQETLDKIKSWIEVLLGL